jgi:hypothetical protein
MPRFSTWGWPNGVLECHAPVTFRISMQAAALGMQLLQGYDIRDELYLVCL